MKKERLRADLLLVERGFFPTREQAQRAIMAREVFAAETAVAKPGSRLEVDAEIRVRETKPFVSRGGVKLAGALAHFGINPTGWVCLDVGASTGGFTDCLLQAGAARVYAVDVGHSQLDWKIRSDPRVVVFERLNARQLDRTHVPEAIELVVIDVSFISLTLILPAVFPLLHAKGVIVPLIKPQFEVGRNEVGKGGIVRDPMLHAAAVEKIRVHVESTGHQWLGCVESSITGTDGNLEFLACLRG